MTKKTTKTDNYYSTSDLSCATTLSFWYPIEAVDRSNPRKSIFAFKKDKNFNELLQSYWRRELKIEPQTYFSQLKIVKARLYEEP